PRQSGRLTPRARPPLRLCGSNPPVFLFWSEQLAHARDQSLAREHRAKAAQSPAVALFRVRKPERIAFGRADPVAVDVFDLGQIAQRVLAVDPAKAAVFDAAEGRFRAGVVREHVVDDDAAGFDPFAEVRGALAAVRE